MERDLLGDLLDLPNTLEISFHKWQDASYLDDLKCISDSIKCWEEFISKQRSVLGSRRGRESVQARTLFVGFTREMEYRGRWVDGRNRAYSVSSIFKTKRKGQSPLFCSFILKKKKMKEKKTKKISWMGRLLWFIWIIFHDFSFFSWITNKLERYIKKEYRWYG